MVVQLILTLVATIVFIASINDSYTGENSQRPYFAVSFYCFMLDVLKLNFAHVLVTFSYVFVLMAIWAGDWLLEFTQPIFSMPPVYF